MKHRVNGSNAIVHLRQKRGKRIAAILRGCVGTAVFILFTNDARGQNAFDTTIIHSITIQFSEPDWDHLLDSMCAAYQGTGASEGRLIATVTIDGFVYDSCGVRYKGHSTYDPSGGKNPLNIDLNTVIAGQDHFGSDKIKLANGAGDPSMVRELMMYELAGAYMHAPRAAYTRVAINGDPKGLYVHTEDVGNEFLDAHFGGSDGAHVKCDPRHRAPWNVGVSNLAYLPDSMAYDTLYDLRSDHGLGALQVVCYQLENDPSTIDQHLDVDRVLWFHALSNLFVHLDGYYAFAHNYYLYQRPGGRWSPVLWDLNMAFGGMLADGVDLAPLNMQQLQQIDPFHMVLSPAIRPLIAQLLSQPLYARMYAAHYRTILEEMVSSGHYLDRAEHWHDLIDADMQIEPYPHYPYADFQANLYTDVGTLLTLRPGISALMDGRATNLATRPYLTVPQPWIEPPIVAPPVPEPNSTVTITALIFDAQAAWLGHRTGTHAPFVRSSMYDDGTHGDLAPGDGTYTRQLTVQGGDLHYYIYAENGGTGVFSPARAEHEFHLLEVQKVIVLNEAQSANVTTQADQDGEFDDWVELFNTSAQPVDLSGYGLSDDPSQPMKWTFPDTIVPANGFLVVWADDDLLQEGLHANFKLSASGEGLFLNGPDAVTRDQVELPLLSADGSYGRYPNGDGPWQVLYPTWNTWNGGSVATPEAPLLNGPRLFPTPTSDACTVLFDASGPHQLRVYNAMGSFVRSVQGRDARLTLDLANEPVGIYLVEADGVWLRAVKSSPAGR